MGVVHHAENDHGLPALTVSDRWQVVTCRDCRRYAPGELTADGTRLAVEACRALRVAPVQGPAGAPFRPGDRFRWTSGNGLTVRTGRILDWWPYVAGSSLAGRSWGSWYVEVDPLPKPRGARPRKNNPWDGFRTWFTGDEMGVVERVT